jgi:hypothetical protein
MTCRGGLNGRRTSAFSRRRAERAEADTHRSPHRRCKHWREGCHDSRNCRHRLDARVGGETNRPGGETPRAAEVASHPGDPRRARRRGGCRSHRVRRAASWPGRPAARSALGRTRDTRGRRFAKRAGGTGEAPNRWGVEPRSRAGRWLACARHPAAHCARYASSA